MNEKKSYLGFSAKEHLLPQEELLEVAPKKHKMVIGIPKEMSEDENRVALVPDAVNLLIESGHRVLVERDAGEAAHFSNEKYAEAGAEIMDTSDEVFKSDIIIKISPPVDEEIEKMGKQKTLFSSIFLPDREKLYFRKLMAKKVNAIAFEYIQDKTGSFPVLKSMSEIIGNTSVLIAAEYLSNSKYGKGEMLGGFPGIKPTEVIIIGAGTVAEYAARTALGMGALVKIFDDSMYKLRTIEDKLKTRVFTATLQPKLLLKAMREADVVIAAKHASGYMAPCLITEDMVKQMKPGSVIVDVSIDQGGCFETSHVTSHRNPVFQEYGITHYCVPNIASRIPHTASYSLSNLLTPLLLSISELGGIDKMLKKDAAFCKGAYIYNGILTNKFIGDLYDLPWQDLELLMAAF
ncbi:MAG TPA: alanine dehydrogenase [Bacteroidetes bacterium]|nr:alanine dehydrogenase [Bacteroidota bacterium]